MKLWLKENYTSYSHDRLPLHATESRLKKLDSHTSKFIQDPRRG